MSELCPINIEMPASLQSIARRAPVYEQPSTNLFTRSEFISRPLTLRTRYQFVAGILDLAVLKPALIQERGKIESCFISAGDIGKKEGGCLSERGSEAQPSQARRRRRSTE